MKMSWKRTTAMWLSATLIFLTAWGLAPAETRAASDSIHLFLNGRLLLSEVSARIVEDTTVVPVRIIAEEIGAKVQWEGETRRVKVEQDQVRIDLQIDNAEAQVNGSAAKLPVPPMIVDGSTLLPLRFVGESLGIKVSWDGLNRSVYLFKAPQEEGSPAGTDSGGGVRPADPVDVPATGGTEAEGEEPGGEETIPGEEANPPAASKPPATTSPSGSGGSGTNGTQSPAPGGTGTAIPPKPGESPPNGGTKPPAKPGANGKPGTDGTGVAKPSGLGEPALSWIEADEQGLKLYTGTEVQPSYFYLSNPRRLVIDLPEIPLGATINGVEAVQNGEILADHPYIGKIRYAKFSSEPLVARVVVDLKEDAMGTLAEESEPGWQVLQLQKPGKPPAPPAKDKYIVVIDAGHGGKDVGATSVKKRYEKDFNLPLANKLYALLKKNPKLEPIMTRSDDTFIELEERAAMANRLGADLFLSIHGNTYKTNIRGTETYYTRPESLAFANIIHRYALEATGFPDRNVRQSGFKVTKETVMPAVLLEVGYLSHPAEEAEMYKSAFQNRLAASLAAAIQEYLQIDSRE